MSILERVEPSVEGLYRVAAITASHSLDTTSEVASRALRIATVPARLFLGWQKPVGDVSLEDTNFFATTYDTLDRRDRRAIRNILRYAVNGIEPDFFENSTLVVAERLGHIIGAACCNERQFDEEIIGHISCMAVLPDMRGHGVGHGLLTGAEEVLASQGHDAVFLIATSVEMEDLCTSYVHSGIDVYSKLLI